MVKVGKYSISYDNVYLLDAITTSGPLEYEGPLGKYIDKTYKDNHCGESTWEKAEILMLEECINELKNRNENNKIDLAILGDLNNQITASNFVMRDFDIPFFGIYSACSTFTESVILGSMFIDTLEFDNVIIGASSHNSCSERQFRSPTEYGGQKKITSTYTVTGAGVGLLSHNKSKIRITRSTMGVVYDAKIKDPSDLGTAMAPAAALTLINHLNDYKISPTEYDLILTGDLSTYGSNVFREIVTRHGIDIKSNYNDCGLLIYDVHNQDVQAGGSGAAASAIVTLGYVRNLLEDGALKKVLIIATGALFNPIMTLQKESIPCIAHAIVMEVAEWIIY